MTKLFLKFFLPHDNDFLFLGLIFGPEATATGTTTDELQVRASKAHTMTEAHIADLEVLIFGF